MTNFITILKHLLVVPDTFDPDDLRRRQVLNTVMIFFIVIGIVSLIVIYVDEDVISGLQNEYDAQRSLLLLVGLILFSALLWKLNRLSWMPKDLIGWILVMGILAILSVADEPRQLTSGRSIFIWAIPITLSVIVLPPASIFVVDFVITIVFWFLGGAQWKYFQYYTLFEIYTVSFMSWMGMSIAERAIRDARNESLKNATILEGVAEGVIVLGPNRQIVLANQAASELLGTEMATIVPMTESVEIDGRALSFRWSQVKGVGQVAIVHDVSRQLEADRAKDAILRVVSHEMRTPLAAILGFAEILEARPVPGLATRIRANAQRMLKLVNDLLDVAQLQAGVLSVQKDNFAPAILASHVLENFSKLADEKGIVLEVNLSPALPKQVTGDVQRLEQVLSNLVSNAIKFTETGGQVGVSFCAVTQTNWKIVVQDTGIGIPPERLSDIFEPFRRASDYAKRKHQGVGLGLAIVKRIVQLSGGEISVESMIGKGSTFIVTLPNT
jgi:signal transduction histidine kinase